MLNHPEESLIFQVDLLDMVNRVDICIEILKSYVRTFGVASKPFVLIIFSVATLSRGISLSTPIPAMYGPRPDVDNDQHEFRRVIARPLLRNFEKDVLPTAQYHLPYMHFKSVSTKVVPLLGELERRARPYPNELSAQNVTTCTFQRVRAFWYLWSWWKFGV